ncbi:MAG: short chain dehydrogenase, partial [Myxococcota bacterium]
MADFLLQISSNKRARQVVQTLGLPLPMPERLERAPEAWSERPLHDRPVVVGSGPAPELTAELARALTAAGADPWVVGGADTLAAWRAAGEGWGRPPHDANAAGPERPWALVLDASGAASPEDLRALYDFFQPRVRSIARSGRLVVLG